MLSSNSQTDFNRSANEARSVLDTPSKVKSIPSATSARRISVSTALKTTTSSKKLPLTSSILAASKSASKVRQSMGVYNRTPGNRLSVGGIVLGAHMHSSAATLAASDISALSLTTTGPSEDMENCGPDATGAQVGDGVARQLFPDRIATHTPQTPADTTNASGTTTAAAAVDGAVPVSEAHLAVHSGMTSPGVPLRRKSIAPTSGAPPASGSLAKKLLTPGKTPGGAVAGAPSRRQSAAHTTMGPNILTSHQKLSSTPAGQKLASTLALSKPSATPTRRQSLAQSLPTTASASAKKALLSSQTPTRRSLAPGVLRSKASDPNPSDIQLHSGALAQKTYTPPPTRSENSLSESRSLEFFPEPNVIPAPTAPGSPYSTTSASGLTLPTPSTRASIDMGISMGARTSECGIGGIGLGTSISENNLSGIFDPSLTFPPGFSDRRVSTCSALSEVSLMSSGTGMDASAGVTPLVSPTNSTNTSATAAAAAAAGGPSQDRIRVMVRVRPTTDPCVRVRGNVLALLEDGKNKSREFAFDSVLGEQVSQEQVYLHAGRAAVEAVREGYPATILAYGQTASGKTHTMLGRAEEGAEGLIPRCGRALMDVVAASDGSMSVTVGYLEVYNEEVFDLLSVDDGKLTIRKNTHGSGFRAEGQCHIPVDSLSALLGVVACGDQKRRVSATSQNERSSRSHAILTLTLHRRERSREGDAAEEEEFVLSNPLHLVDLAGSERYHAEKGSESVHINQSLTTLATVMKNLVEGSQYINYRDSELTKLLGDSLSGHACTTLIACVHGDRNNRQETVSTLRFANTAKQIPVHAEKWTSGPRVSRKVLEQQLRSFQTQYAELLQAQEREAVRWTSEREDILRVQAQLLEEKALVESEKESIVREQRRAARAKEEESRLQELHVLPRLDSLIRKLHKLGLWSSSSAQGLLASPRHAPAPHGRDGVDVARPTHRLGSLLASPLLTSPSQRYNALLHSPLLLSPAHRGADAHNHSHSGLSGGGALSDRPSILTARSPMPLLPETMPAPTATAATSMSLDAAAKVSTLSPSQTPLLSPTTRRHRNKYALTIMASPSSTSSTLFTATQTSSSAAVVTTHDPVAPALTVAYPAMAAHDASAEGSVTASPGAATEDALPCTPPKRTACQPTTLSSVAARMTAHAPPPITVSPSPVPLSPVPIPLSAAAANAATPTPTSRHRTLASPDAHGLAGSRALAQLASPSMQALQHQENLDSRTVTMYAQFLKLLKVLEHVLPHYQPPSRGVQADKAHGDTGLTSMPSSPFIASLSSPKAGKKRSMHLLGHSHPFSGPFAPPTCALSRDNASAAPSPSSPPSPSTPSSSLAASTSTSSIATLASPVVSRRRAHAQLLASVAAHHVRITSAARTHTSLTARHGEEAVDAAQAQAETRKAEDTAAELASLRAELAAGEAALADVRVAAAAAHAEQAVAVSALAAQLANSRESLAQTESRAGAAEKREQAKEAALAAAEAARVSAESVVFQARTEQEYLRSSTTAALEELRATNAEAVADVARLWVSVDVEAAARAEAEAQLVAREAALAQEQTARATAEQKLAPLIAALFAAEEARAAQEQRVQTLLSEVENERAARSAAETRACALSEELRTTRNSQTEDTAQLRAECTSLRVRVGAAEAMSASLRAQLDAATERGVALQASLDAARAEVESAEKYSAELEAAHTAALAAERAAHIAAMNAMEEEVGAAAAKAKSVVNELKAAHAAQLFHLDEEHAATLATVQAEHAQALLRVRAESAALVHSSQGEAAAVLEQVRAESAEQLAVAAAALAVERARVAEAAAQRERDAALLAQFREQLCVVEARRSVEETQVSELRGVQETLEKQLLAAKAAHAASLEVATRVANAATAAEATLARELASVTTARAIAEQERDAAMAECDALIETLLRAREMALGGADTPTGELTAGGACGGPSTDADMVAPAISALRNELSAYAHHAAAVQEQLRASEEKRARLRQQALVLCRAGGARSGHGDGEVGVCYGERMTIDSDIEVDMQMQSLSPACLFTHNINAQASNIARPRQTQTQSSGSPVANASTTATVSTMSALSPRDNSQYSRSAKFAAELRSRRERARRATMLEEQGWW